MAFKTKYLKQKEKFDDYTFKHSLWNRFEEHELSENQANFLSQCMSENLEHARHVENERLTFNSIFLALVAGAMAFGNALPAIILFLIYFFLMIAEFLSMILTVRWNNAFDRHIFYAQKCYKLLHINLFGKVEEAVESWETPESIDDLDEIPMYCFKIQRPIAHTKFGNKIFSFRTRHLYIAFYWVVQILIIFCAVLNLSAAIRGEQ